MLVAAFVLAALAALLHVYIFYLESFAWTSKRGRATFGMSEQNAQATKELAFNQGFYNLFLAIATFAGIVAYLFDAEVIGITLVFVGIGSMAAAATVLFLSSPDKRNAALKQGAIPYLGVAALTLALSF